MLLVAQVLGPKLVVAFPLTGLRETGGTNTPIETIIFNMAQLFMMQHRIGRRHFPRNAEVLWFYAVFTRLFALVGEL